VIQLRESILIDVPPERVWGWLGELPDHYRAWHPAHVSCRYEHGRRLEVGTVLYVEEYLHHRLHRLRLRATEVVPNRLLGYRGRGFAGAFRLEPANGGTRFTAELDLGTRAPVVGHVLDAVIRLLLGRRLAAMRSHVREEGENLKRLLEGPDSRSQAARTV
jgi:hypothetical protein